MENKVSICSDHPARNAYLPAPVADTGLFGPGQQHDQLCVDHLVLYPGGQRACNGDAERIHTTLENVDREALSLAVNAILKGKRVYIIGTRSSASLASFFGYYLTLLKEHVHIVQDTAASEIIEQLFRVGAGDVVVGISFPRYSSRTHAAVKFAKSKGATTVCITDCEASPLSKVSDVTLYAKTDMISFIDSLVAPMCLLNALLAEIGYRSRENISDTFRRLEDVWSEYAMFLTDEQ